MTLHPVCKALCIFVLKGALINKVIISQFSPTLAIVLQSLTHFVTQPPFFVLCYPIITHTEKPDNQFIAFPFYWKDKQSWEFEITTVVSNSFVITISWYVQYSVIIFPLLLFFFSQLAATLQLHWFYLSCISLFPF